MLGPRDGWWEVDLREKKKKKMCVAGWVRKVGGMHVRGFSWQQWMDECVLGRGGEEGVL